MEFFANDRYTVLKLLQRYSFTFGGRSYTKLSQQEIAEAVHFSKVKVNRIIRELLEHGYIGLSDGKRGRYEITEPGLSVLKAFSV